MDFRILGPLEVHHEGRALPLGGARQRELLGLLLLNAGQVVSSDRLMDELWGEDQPTAGATALRVRLSQLRKALRPGGDPIVTRPPGYALQVDPGALDLWRFERALADGEQRLGADPQAAIAALDRALAEWRGRPLDDLAYTPFAQAAIARLEELHARALELRIEAQLALGHHARAIGELQTLVGEHPLRERLWAQLMTALYRDGRQGDALAAYRAARARLVEDIGLEPGPELQALEARILAQDPGLSGPAAGPTAEPARVALAVTTGGDDAPVRVAERLRAVETVAVALVAGAAEIAAATARLRQSAPAARVAAFTTADPAADTVRLAAEQDAAILLLAAPPEVLAGGALDGDTGSVLRAAACDVGLLAGAPDWGAGPVMVPFAGDSHDWAAAEIGAWLGGGAVTLLGVTGGERDASRLLASASLALQRGLGVTADTALAGAGAEGVLEATAGAAAVVVGLSERWGRDGLGRARLRLAREAPCPVLLVRRGVRPGGLAPPDALTRFSWSGGG